MNIKPETYEALTTQERIVASVEALARDDTKEKERLVTSCPKRHYKMNDADFVNKMQGFAFLSTVVELDLRGIALDLMTLLWLQDSYGGEEFSEERLEKAFGSIFSRRQEATSIRQAWHEFMTEEGVDIETAKKAYESDMHYVVKNILLELDPKIEIEPNDETVSKYKKLLKEHIGKVNS